MDIHLVGKNKAQFFSVIGIVSFPPGFYRILFVDDLSSEDVERMIVESWN